MTHEEMLIADKKIKIKKKETFESVEISKKLSQAREYHRKKYSKSL